MESCQKERPLDSDEYVAGPLFGHVVCTSGFAAVENVVLQKMVEECGGSFVRVLNATASHLLVPNAVNIEALRATAPALAGTKENDAKDAPEMKGRGDAAGASAAVPMKVAFAFSNGIPIVLRTFLEMMKSGKWEYSLVRQLP